MDGSELSEAASTLQTGDLTAEKNRQFQENERVPLQDSTVAFNVLKRAADFCNALPFSGKMAITPAAYNVWKEENPYYKSIRMAEAAGLLSVMVLGHSFQTGLGVEKLKNNVEALQSDPSPEVLIACGIDIAYTAANCAATYAQLHVSGRLADHYLRTDLTSVPLLREWGVDGDDINYHRVAENLTIALANNDQDDVDSFFMVLGQEDKQRVMEEVHNLKHLIDETYSYEEIGKRIAQLDHDVDKKSKLRYMVDIVKNAHRRDHSKQYSFKEAMTMLMVTMGGQLGFVAFG